VPDALRAVKTLVYGGAVNDRLTKADWIRQGLRTLAGNGPSGLKVGSMSASLNVSRGSFYWHFRDITEFRSHLLRDWQERTTDQFILDLEAENAAPDRLKFLLRRAFNEKRNMDRAIRAWGAEDADVAATVAAVDAKRVAYMAKLLTAAGVPTKAARDRATFLYWAYLGQTIIMDASLSSIAASAIDDLSDLLET